MLDVMRFWLDRGLDGFRCDAVPYLVEREGTNCENLPRRTRSSQGMVRAAYPGSAAPGFSEDRVRLGQVLAKFVPSRSTRYGTARSESRPARGRARSA